MTDRLLRRREVEDLVGLKKTAIYDRIGSENFPRPVHLNGTRTARWRLSAVQAWIEQQGVG